MIQTSFILNGSAAIAARDRGIDQAATHAEESSPGWSDRTITALRIFCENLKAGDRREFLFEEFRVTRGSDAPHSHKAWGSIPGVAIRLGIIKFTGRYEPAKSLKTHGHEVRVYVAM